MNGACLGGIRSAFILPWKSLQEECGLRDLARAIGKAIEIRDGILKPINPSSCGSVQKASLYGVESHTSEFD